VCLSAGTVYWLFAICDNLVNSCFLRISKLFLRSIKNGTFEWNNNTVEKHRDNHLLVIHLEIFNMCVFVLTFCSLCSATVSYDLICICGLHCTVLPVRICNADMASSEGCKSSLIFRYRDRCSRRSNVARPRPSGEAALQWPVQQGKGNIEKFQAITLLSIPPYGSTGWYLVYCV